MRLLILGLAAIGIAGAAFAEVRGQPALLDLPLVPLALAIAFLAFDRCEIHVELREEAHTFTLGAIALTAGLFMTSPTELLAARLVAQLISARIDRDPPLRGAFNVSLGLFQTGVALIVFSSAPLLVGSSGWGVAWPAALVAVVAADCASALVLELGMRLNGGGADAATVRAMLALGVVAEAGVASLALMAVRLLEVDAGVLVPTAILAGVLVIAYRAYARVLQRLRSLQDLYDFTQALGQVSELRAALQLTLLQAREALRSESAELVLSDADGGAVSMRLDSGDNLITELHDVPADPRWSVIDSGQPLLVGRDSREQSALLERLGVRDLLVVPLTQGDRGLGFLAVADRWGEVSTFVPDDVQVLGTLANHANVALENGRLIERLRAEVAEKHHQATHDSLTGLPNRAAFQQRAELALRETGERPPTTAVMLLDLNGFTDVNDSLGHHHGDRLLALVGRRVRSVLPDGATLARLGGDEFAIVLPDLSQADAAVAVAERISAVLARPFQLEGLSLTVNAAIGIACAPDHASSVSMLLQRADIAMYAAKEQRGTAVVMYTPAVHQTEQRSRRRLSLAGDLRSAIEREELRLVYQPKARTATREIVGVEALARWEHPELGPIPPDEFVRLADHVGLSAALTRFVLHAAVRQARRWHDEGFPLNVAVNLSARTLTEHNDVPAWIREELEATGLDPAALTVELTETELMVDPESALEHLNSLAALGVQLSVDDFGTGYSSLNYLRQLPVHEVKIDRSFISGLATEPDDHAIVAAIIDMSRHLELEVVAEGVEDQRTWDVLTMLGCGLVQGYALSRPVPAEALSAWLAQRRTVTSVTPLRRNSA